jgi:hypothetical protein
MEFDVRYQLHKYILTNLTGILCIVGYETSGSPQENIRLHQSGGSPSHDIDRQDVLIQFISSYFSQTKSFEEISRVYGLLRNKFNILLPAVVVDKKNYLAVTAWRIVANQVPGEIGADEKGRFEYSVNFTVTIGS